MSQSSNAERKPAVSDEAELSAAQLADEMEALGQRMADVRTQIGRVIYGQQDVIDQVLTTILAGGHLLLVGVPGLAPNPSFGKPVFTKFPL